MTLLLGTMLTAGLIEKGGAMAIGPDAEDGLLALLEGVMLQFVADHLFDGDQFGDCMGVVDLLDLVAQQDTLLIVAVSQLSDLGDSLLHKGDVVLGRSIFASELLDCLPEHPFLVENPFEVIDAAVGLGLPLDETYLDIVHTPFLDSSFLGYLCKSGLSQHNINFICNYAHAMTILIEPMPIEYIVSHLYPS